MHLNYYKRVNLYHEKYIKTRNALVSDYNTSFQARRQNIMPSSQRINEYKERISIIKDNLFELNATNSKDRDNEIETTFQEITQSIKTIEQDNDLIVVEGSSNGAHIDQLFVDYESIPAKIEEFNKLLTSLIMLYLEQESLDQFLRHTLTTSNNENSFLLIKSFQDPKYKTLETQVKILKEDNLEERELQVNDLRKQISSLSDSIQSLENDISIIKEQSNNDLDECLELFDELENIYNDKKVKSEMESAKKDDELLPLEQIANEWNNISILKVEKQNLLARLHKLKQTFKKDNEDSKEEYLKDQIRQKEINHKAITKLIDLQENQLLSKFDGVTNFVMKYEQHYFTFIVRDVISIKCYLNEYYSFENIEISEKNNNDSMIRQHELENKICKKFYHTDNIFHIIKYIRSSF